jgi:hypothetical protein
MKSRLDIGHRAGISLIDSLVFDFLVMRTKSHHSPGIFRQLLLAFRWGLTYRLYALSFRFKALKADVEVRGNHLKSS